MSELRYPVPWDLVFSLGPHIYRGSRASFDHLTAAVSSRIQPEPLIRGIEHLPATSRFVIVANHYQRPGLWIAHSASIITQVIRRRYGAGDPPMRWIVTANWPAIRIGPWKLPSPGDWLLPRVAKALSCYPIAFAGTNPQATAGMLRRLLRDARTVQRPIGIFPQGAASVAGQPDPPLAGVDRLLRHLAKLGLPLQPVRISEQDRLVFEFTGQIPCAEVIGMSDPARQALGLCSRESSLKQSCNRQP